MPLRPLPGNASTLSKTTPILFALILVALAQTSCANGSLSAVNSPTSATVSNTTANTSSPPQGYVSINFDDGYESAYLNAMPILDSAGIKVTHFVITRLLGRSGFMTLEQLSTMKANGHEIGAHTRTHPHLPTLTEDQQRSEILGSYDDLVAFGLRPTLFAYPFGEFNSTSVSIARGSFLASRTVYGAANTSSTDSTLLNCYSIHPGAPVYAFSDIAKLIDTAQSKGTWLILLFHRVDEETGDSISVPHELIQQVVDYLKARNVRVVTMSEGMQLTFAPHTP